MKRFSILNIPRLASQHCALALAVCAAVASPGTARAQNLVLNGEFDTAAFAPSAGNAAEAKVSRITGWSLSGAPTTYVNGVWVGPSGTTGHWLLLGGTMSQTITSLPAGDYTFSFNWFRRRADVGGSGEEMAYHVTGPGGLSVTGDTTGNQIAAEWHQVSQTVTLASAGDVTISFAVTGNDWGIGMDNMAFSGPGADGDKVVNGNLETDAALAPNAGNTATTMKPGGITDWSLSGARTYYVNGVWPTAEQVPAGTTGHWLLLGGNLSQTLLNVPAGTYAFSYDWFRRRPDVGGSGEEMAYHVTGPGGLSVTGNTMGNQTASLWHTESQTVTLAAAGDVTLSFTVSGNDWGIGVDKIALAPSGGGGYAAWAGIKGVTGEPDGDSNHDGVQNGIAYFMDNAGLITNPSLDASNKVTWPMSATFSGSYEVQISTDLSHWQPAVPQPTRNGAGNLEYTLPSGAVGGKNFVRLLVTPTP